MEKELKTLETYNKDPQYYSDKFTKHLITRERALDEVFSLVTREPGVLELGCGDGRDAEYLIKRSKTYLGVDGSSGMLDLARKRLPQADFMLADIRNLNFPVKSFDIIFSFAVLLHLNKDEVGKLLKKAREWLKHGGVFSVYVKEGRYEEIEKLDSIGIRYFYHYEEGDLLNLAGNGYKLVKTERFSVGNHNWIEVILRKASFHE